MSKNEKVYFYDMLKAIEQIERARQAGFEEWAYIRILERNLEIVGEAANRISKKTQAQYSGIPWEKIISTRNLVIHAYDGVNPEILHNIVWTHLPGLKADLQKILDEWKD